MATRPIYIPCYSGDLLVRTDFVDFVWHPGMAPSQKKKSIFELHKAAKIANICKSPLEISSKSSIDLGVQLSAFNLSAGKNGEVNRFTVETAYQSSKVFQNGGPYRDILYGTSLAAKKDPRLKSSGDLIAFESSGKRWSLEPKTAFYDWLYLTILNKNNWAFDALDDYDAFTDIEFNPKKSVNCQAYSVALFKSLRGRNILKDALSSIESFLGVVDNRPVNNASEDTSRQPTLL